MTELRALVARSSDIPVRLALQFVTPRPIQPRTPAAAGASRALATGSCASELGREELAARVSWSLSLPVTASVYRSTV
jgi:hypothetical protein